MGRDGLSDWVHRYGVRLGFRLDTQVAPAAPGLGILNEKSTLSLSHSVHLARLNVQLTTT